MRKSHKDLRYTCLDQPQIFIITTDMASITINPTYNQSSINITGEEKLLTVGKNGTSTVSINLILDKVDDSIADKVEDQVNEKIDEVVDNISNLNWNDV